MKIIIEVKQIEHPTEVGKRGLACRLVVDNQICTTDETEFARFIASKIDSLVNEFREWAENPDAKDFKPHGGIERIREIGQG